MGAVCAVYFADVVLESVNRLHVTSARLVIRPRGPSPDTSVDAGWLQRACSSRARACGVKRALGPSVLHTAPTRSTSTGHQRVPKRAYAGSGERLRAVRAVLFGRRPPARLRAARGPAPGPAQPRPPPRRGRFIAAFRPLGSIIVLV